MLYSQAKAEQSTFSTATLELRRKLDQEYKALDDERRANGWFEHWRELVEFLMPQRGRFLLSDDNRGDKVMSKVLDSEGLIAARTLMAGMMAGMSPRSKPWFRLLPEDKKLVKVHAVKQWLSECEDVLYLIFHQSNFYQSIAQLYGELGVIGTAAMVVFEDWETVIRCETLTVGEYMLAQNSRRICDTMLREFQMSLRQMVDMFGIEALPAVYREKHQAQAYGTSTDHVRYPIRHYVGPNPNRKPGPATSANMPFASIYWAPACGDNAHIIQFKGFEENALVAPRWDTTGNNTYGRSPGMDALPDVKQLQTMTRRFGQGVDRMNNPPLQGPAALKSVALDLLPGGVNLYDVAGAQNGLRSIYENFRPDLAAMSAQMDKITGGIKRAMFSDLFFAISQMEGVQPRQEMELLLRQEEKLGALGPVVDRIQPECLDPTIDRAWGICMRNGLFPDPPQELMKQPVKVDYISMLALAQKAMGIGNYERFVGVIGNMAGAYPEVRDKVNPDAFVDDYADKLGVSATLMHSDEEVARMRGARAQAAQAQAMAQAAPALKDGAAAAKLLSELDTSRQKPSVALQGF